MRFRKLKDKFLNINLGLKIALFYFILVVASTSLSSLIYNEVYLNITRKKVSEMSIQTLNSIQSNINLMISNVDSYSKMILSDSNLQDLLRQGNMYSNLNTQSKVSSYLYKFIQSVPLISSVYVCDNSNNIYAVGAEVLPTLEADKIKDADWYNQVVEKKGAYVLKLNGGGIVFQNTQNKYVSLIRLIRDIDTTHTLGVLVINIPEKAFEQGFGNISKDIETNVAILDQNNQIVCENSDDKKIKEDTFENFENEIAQITDEYSNKSSGTKLKKVGTATYLISYLSENKYNWKFVSMLPFAKLSEENTAMGLIGFIIIIFNSIVLFISAIIISRIITVPIKHLLNSMKDVEKGVFNEVQVKTQSYEFSRLYNGYNIMIMEIKKLIAHVIKEQKIIRKAELYTLQAQIKPHFLYNTLDSINSLVLSECTNEASELVEALGSYYRISVSKGKELITVGEEINMVKNYLKIQKIRYQDLFTAVYDLDSSCLEYKVPKLVLQPLVENAIYHGIRPKSESGVITVGVDKAHGVVRLWVQDDGIGMSDEQIHAIINNKIGEGSFGLRGTLERIRIIAGNENAFEIESTLGYGTKIILYIHDDDKEGGPNEGYIKRFDCR